MIEEAVLLPIQRSNGVHIFRPELNIEDAEIFLDAFLANGLGNRHDPSLGQPAQDDLRDGLLVFPARDSRTSFSKMLCLPSANGAQASC
jgi:hypothetical protein